MWIYLKENYKFYEQWEFEENEKMGKEVYKPKKSIRRTKIRITDIFRPRERSEKETDIIFYDGETLTVIGSFDYIDGLISKAQEEYDATHSYDEEDGTGLVI